MSICLRVYCDEFGATAVELGVCSTVLVLDDSLPAGANDAYELISLLFKELVRVNGSEDVATVVKRSIATLAPLFSSHRMVRDYAIERYAPVAHRA